MSVVVSEICSLKHVHSSAVRLRLPLICGYDLIRCNGMKIIILLCLNMILYDLFVDICSSI
jgi:hypothetical protein